MTPPDPLVPRARLATDDAGAVQIDQILARRRSELARLGLAARSAVRRRAAAEKRLADHLGGLEGDLVPVDLLSVVDSMIERSTRACDEALAVARRDADELVAQAVAESIDQLRRAGLDTTKVPAARRPDPGRRVSPPPSAGDLWRRVGAARVPAAVPVDGPPTGLDGDTERTAEAIVLPAAVAGEMAVLPTSSLPSPDTYAEHRTVAVATLVAHEPATGPLTDDDRSAEAFDGFWQEASRERRVRDRFLRRSTKEES